MTFLDACINAVMDHNLGGSAFYTLNQNVRAFTGERGSLAQCGPDATGRFDAGHGAYLSGWNYTAVGLPTCLFYDGHSGTDFRANETDAVYAPAAGRMVWVSDGGDPINGNPLSFNTFYIDHGEGWQSWFLHCLAGTRLPNGTMVERGEQIAQVGSEGIIPPAPHLHYEVRFRGIPVDPYGWEGGDLDPFESSIYSRTNNHLWADAVQVPGDPDVYIIRRSFSDHLGHWITRKWLVTTQSGGDDSAFFGDIGYTDASIRSISLAKLNSFESGPNILAPGSIYRAPWYADPKVYFIGADRRSHLVTAQVFDEFGFDNGDVYVAHSEAAFFKIKTFYYPVSAPLDPPLPTLPGWTDVTHGPLSSPGSSVTVAWGDYDGDGDDDIYLTKEGGAANHLFRNEGGTFVDVTPSLLGDTGNSWGASWADYDDDGDVDLYVANWGTSNHLFRNDGGGVFSDATTVTLAGPDASIGIAWGDYDEDGDPDLYVSAWGCCNQLLRNDGGGIFVDATHGPLGDDGQGFGVSWVDYDSDGDLDIFVANHGTTGNRLFRNSSGTFMDVTSSPLTDPGSWHVPAWGDYDNDGDLDLFISNESSVARLYRNDGGVFVDVTTSPVAASFAHAPTWADFDLDGDLDLFVSGQGTFSRLVRNDGGGVFTEITPAVLNLAQCSGAAWHDYDRDGDPDLYIAGWSGRNNVLIRNDLQTGNHFLGLRLFGQQSSTDAIGARASLSAQGSALAVANQVRTVSGDGFMANNGLTEDFGTGTDDSTKTLTVTWPSGLVQTLENVPMDRHLEILEGDADGDEVSDAVDICPMAPDVDQIDTDSDGVGEECDNCPIDTNSLQDDADGDTVGDACDCLVFDPDSFAVPPEVQFLSIEPDTSTVAWVSVSPLSGDGTFHQVLRGRLSELPVGVGASEICLESFLLSEVATDSSVPPIGDGYYYLVRGRNACGSGIYGHSSSGFPITSAVCP
jgi:hypothetical protein